MYILEDISLKRINKSDDFALKQKAASLGAAAHPNGRGTKLLCRVIAVVQRNLGAVFEFQFAQDITDMRAHGRRADV